MHSFFIIKVYYLIFNAIIFITSLDAIHYHQMVLFVE